MSVISRRPEADPLYAGPQPERAAYATGMLLDVQDFLDEQTYHRGRLARALAFLAGGGTLAGLEVTHRPADAGQPEEIQVAPGIAATASAGSSIRGPPACGSTAGLPARSCATGRCLRTATYDGLDRFISARAGAPGVLPARAVVADVYLRFVACDNGSYAEFRRRPV